MLSFGCERLPTPLKKKKKKKKVLDHYLHHDLGMLPLIRCFFAHLLILQYPDHHQNLISSSLYYSGPVHKISSQSVHNFLSNVVHRQTNKLEALRERRPPWPRQIITLILPTVKMLSLGCERLPTSLKKIKKKKKGSGSLPSPRSGYATTITVFFAHLLILQYPDHHQNLISSSLYYSGPVHKISSQSVHNFLSNVVHRQTNKLEALRERRPPWPRQIITLILPTVKMLSLGCERLPTPPKKKKGSGSLPSPRSGYATTITVFFCSFTHLTIPRSPPKFNQFFLVPSQSVHNFLSNVVHRQTNKQTNRQTN